MPAHTAHPIILANDHIEVGIAPALGGRIMLMRRPGCPNILKAAERYWQKPSRLLHAFPNHARFRGYNGHIVWVGPQSQWWQQQDVNQERKERKAGWPPDLYVDRGANTITHQSPTSLTMVGPDSPISGLRLTKSIELHENGAVSFLVEATNIRDHAISWDLWCNTRVDGFARCYVPIDHSGIQRIGGALSERSHHMPHTVVNGFFTFTPATPPAGRIFRAKAFLNPTRGFIACFDQSQLLTIDFALAPRAAIHPEQAAVELYNCSSPRRSSALLELECHGPYTTLAPGESMTMQQRFELLPYNGPATPEAHCDHLSSSSIAATS
jgi:hypothetical protein